MPPSSPPSTDPPPSTPDSICLSNWGRSTFPWHTQRSRTGCASEYAWCAPVNRWCLPAPTCSRPPDCTSARLQPCSSCALQCGAQPGVPGGTQTALRAAATLSLRGLRGWSRSARARRSQWVLSDQATQASRPALIAFGPAHGRSRQFFIAGLKTTMLRNRGGGDRAG
jgi:hypothetical protein